MQLNGRQILILIKEKELDTIRHFNMLSNVKTKCQLKRSNFCHLLVVADICRETVMLSIGENSWLERHLHF